MEIQGNARFRSTRQRIQEAKVPEYMKEVFTDLLDIVPERLQLSDEEVEQWMKIAIETSESRAEERVLIERAGHKVFAEVR